MIGRPELEAIGLSLLVATAAVASSLPFGIALGWLLARRSFVGKSVVETAVNLPLVLPPVVTGYLLLVLFGRNGPIGGPLDRWLGLSFVFDWKGAAVAAAVVAFPLMVRSIRVGFAGVDGRLVEAARTFGAGPLDAFLTVALPLARPGLIAGCVLAFARALGEFGATVMIAGDIAGRTRTIPLYLYAKLETPGGFENAWPVVAVSVALSAAAVIVAERFERRARTAVERRRRPLSGLSVAAGFAYPTGFRLLAEFDAPPGVTLVAGPSGGGKSTLLSLIAGLLRPETGVITHRGRRFVDAETRTFVPPHRRRAGVCFQDFRLFPHRSVRANLLYGRRRFKVVRRGVPTADDVIGRLGLSDLLDRRPDDLSGGQRQRVALGRALLTNADLFLLDEPVSALDGPLRDAALDLVREAVAATDAVCLFVTHDESAAGRLGAVGRIVVRDGVARP